MEGALHVCAERRRGREAQGGGGGGSLSSLAVKASAWTAVHLPILLTSKYIKIRLGIDHGTPEIETVIPLLTSRSVAVRVLQGEFCLHLPMQAGCAALAKLSRLNRAEFSHCMISEWIQPDAKGDTDGRHHFWNCTGEAVHTSKGLVCPYNGDIEDDDAEHQVADADPHPLVMVCTTPTSHIMLSQSSNGCHEIEGASAKSSRSNAYQNFCTGILQHEAATKLDVLLWLQSPVDRIGRNASPSMSSKCFQRSARQHLRCGQFFPCPCWWLASILLSTCWSVRFSTLLQAS